MSTAYGSDAATLTGFAASTCRPAPARPTVPRLVLRFGKGKIKGVRGYRNHPRTADRSTGRSRRVLERRGRGYFCFN
jgi:hypothetical protein